MVSGRFHEANLYPELGSMPLLGLLLMPRPLSAAADPFSAGGGLGVNFNFGGWPELFFSAAGTGGRRPWGWVG